MRIDPTGSQVTQLDREPRIVIGIIYDTGSIYVTNKAASIANVPGNVVHGVLEDVSSVSRQIDPLEATSTIGGFSFVVTDVDGELTDEIRAQLSAGNGIGQREVRVYTGDTDDFTDGTWSRVDTYVIDSVVAWDRGSYRFECSDRQRELRTKIFPKVTTRLASTITATSTTLSVTSAEGFDLVPHTASFSDAPSTSVCYVRVNKTKEIIRFTGIGSPASFTGCTRGVFGTVPQAVTVNTSEDQEKWPELELVYYLEMPAPQMAYALATGVILDSGSPVATLPDGYHAGIDPSYVDADAVRNIGTDLYDPADPTGGLVLFFSTARGLKETNAKRFIEEQLLFPMWAFWAINAEGVLELRKLTRLLADAAPSAIAYSENIIDHGALENRIDQLANRVIFNWNHDGQDFTRNTELVNLGSISAHRLGRTLEYDLQGFVVARHTRATFQRLFNSIVERYGAPPQEFELVLSSELNRLEVGDVIRVVLEGVRDYAGLAYLDRSFEIVGRTWNPRTGEFRVRLFGSTSAFAQDQPSGSGAALDDAWYTSEGTELSTVLTISAGAVTANGSLTGDDDLRNAVYYYDGDLTINTGVTVTISDNVQLRVKGTLTVNGAIDGAGQGIDAATDPHSVDDVYTSTNGRPYLKTFGSTRPSASLVLPQNSWLTNFPNTFRGIPAATPFNVSVDSGALVGLPAELRGTEGHYGPPTLIISSGYRVKAKGGAGGAGGAGLAIICRGLAFGASGEIDLSGANGSSAVGTYAGGGRTVVAGAGAGGAPGILAVFLDGNDVLYPDLTDAFVANHGATPQTGTPVTQSAGTDPSIDPITGNDPGIGASDMWQSAHIVQWVPQEIDTGESEDEVVPAPSGLTATDDGAGVLLQWVSPPDDLYDVVEIWEATTNDRTGALKVAELKGNAKTLTNAASVTRYYWIRARDTDTGWSDWHPTSSTGGVEATFGGATGPQGDPGEDAISVSITASNGVQFRQATGGTWEPSGTTTDITFTFKQGGSDIATHVIRVTRSDETLTAATQSESGDATSETIVGSGTAVVTLIVEHDDSGITAAQAVSAVKSGADTSMVTPVDSAGKPSGWRGVDGITDRSQVQFGGIGIQILSSPVTTVAYGLPAIPIDDSTTYTITVRHRSSAASADGFYVYMLELNGPLPAGKTHVGWAAGGMEDIAEGADTANPVALNTPMPGTAVVENTYTYTPTAGTEFATLALYNYDPATAGVTYEVEWVRMTRAGSNVNLLTAGAPTVDLTTQIRGLLAASFAGFTVDELSGSVSAAQMTTNVLAAMQAVVGSLSAIVAELGSAVISTTGHLRSGQTAFNTGTGWFLGHNGSNPVASIGNPSGARFTFDGSTGEIQVIPTVKTFTPSSWTGFSSDPSGSISYVDFGSFVIMWRESNLQGVSNNTDFELAGVPAAIRPASGVRSYPCTLVDGTDAVVLGWADVVDDGRIVFYKSFCVDGAGLQRSASIWAATGIKGLASGWTLVYSK